MVRYTPVSHNPFAENNSKIPAANALASAGRGGDTLLAHVTPGDITIPAEMRNSGVDAALKNILGDNFDRYTAGASANSRNPQTNLIEFEGTGAEGTGEGPGAEGGVGGNGPGGGGTGGAGNGASGTDGGAPEGGHGTDPEGPETNDPPDPFGGNQTTTTGLESQTVVDAKHDPPVSDTVSQTGLPGLFNDLTNHLQSKLSEFQNDPAAVVGAAIANIGLAALTANLSSVANLGLAIAGKQSLGMDVVDAAKDIFGSNNSSSSTSASTDSNSTGGVSTGAVGSPGSGAGNHGDGGDSTDEENALLSKFYQSLLPSPINAGGKGSSVIDIGKLVALPDQSPSRGTNTKQYL